MYHPVMHHIVDIPTWYCLDYTITYHDRGLRLFLVRLVSDKTIVNQYPALEGRSDTAYELIFTIFDNNEFYLPSFIFEKWVIRLIVRVRRWRTIMFAFLLFSLAMFRFLSSLLFLLLIFIFVGYYLRFRWIPKNMTLS